METNPIVRADGGSAPPRSARRASAAIAAALLALAVAPHARAADYDPVATSGSMYNTTLMTGAQNFWKAGFTGKDVDVAVIDTGTATVPGLDAPGKLVYGADVSFDGAFDEARHVDGYGHGTHMAGIIAGRDGGELAPAAYAGRPDLFLGMAPDARIVSLKVGDADGAVDVTQVIAAIDWVVAHRRDAGLNIRVLNLSYGVDSRQASGVDPLSHAVEHAWKAGIVVVAAGGNEGTGLTKSKTADGLMAPARDPFVIAVGATNPQGTNTYKDDTVAAFSSLGDGTDVTKRDPDVVAPGTSIHSLRVPGSNADQSAGDTAAVAERFFKGSGTSQAAAVVSGAVALLVQRFPDITPDGVKRLLRDKAVDLPNTDDQAQGKGEFLLTPLLTMKPSTSAQSFAWSNGTGSIEAARGSYHLVMDDVQLAGEVDVFGTPIDAAALAAARQAGTVWNGGSWFGRALTGDAFLDAVDGVPSAWAGRSWTGNSWSGRSWTGRSWTGRSWTGRSWTGEAWTGRSWTGGAWVGRSWTADLWSSAGWK